MKTKKERSHARQSPAMMIILVSSILLPACSTHPKKKDEAVATSIIGTWKGPRWQDVLRDGQRLTIEGDPESGPITIRLTISGSKPAGIAIVTYASVDGGRVKITKSEELSLLRPEA